MSMHFRFLDHPNCLNDDDLHPSLSGVELRTAFSHRERLKQGHFGYASVSESTLTLAGYNGNPEPVKEKTLKNSREFFAKHVGPALAQPMRKDGQEVKDLKSERG